MFIVIAFFAGVIFTYITMHLAHKQTIRLMKLDAFHAIEQIVSDLSGLMNGMPEEKTPAKTEDAETALIPVTV